MTITPRLFEVFLKCPTKCWLRFIGEPPAGNAYAEWVQTEHESHRADAAKRLIANTPADEGDPSPGSGRRKEAHSSAENLKAAKWRVATDVPVQTELRSSRGHEAQTSSTEINQSLLTSAATVAESCLHAIERIPSESRGRSAQFIPIRFIYRNKLTQDDKLLLAFDALVLSEMLGREVSLGKIIHGDDHATLKVKTSALTGEVRKRLQKIAALLSSPTPPDLVLNRHCAECEFQARCRKIAVEKDDLSLLAGMSAKERQKLRSKGIFTVTQLSYTFRPRRRPKRLRDKREKYHHSLKALAIREKKIHIVGSPELKIEGTPVYLDVEGLPDRDFYYLIGLRIGHGDSTVQHSLWADTVSDEGKIWHEFLALLETVEQPVLIHYGSYETSFIKQMAERHGSPKDESVAAKAIASALNIVSAMFAQIYFPTHSNGLKAIAGLMGFVWPNPESTGLQSVMWRRQWKETEKPQLKQHLLAYNSADCQACELLVRNINQLARPRKPKDPPMSKDVAFVVDNLPNSFSHPDWRTFEGVLPELNGINRAAQWDYQRDRVYLRSKNKLAIKSANIQKAGKKVSLTESAVSFPQCPVCPDCSSKSSDEREMRSRFFRDLVFGRSLVKGRKVRHDFRQFWCKTCRQTFGVPKRFHSWQGLGWNLVALYFYMAVELAFPQRPIAALLEKLFNISISAGDGSRLKTRVGRYYEMSRQFLIEKLANAHVVHVDETTARVRSGAGYVWVFATSEVVVYLFSESREAEILQRVLGSFKGVLVSDFYTAYDSIDVPQQKCLIHLIRDMNNEILAQPYDEELKRIVGDFAALLKPIIETIYRFGLRKHHLRKYSRPVEQFFNRMVTTEFQSEAAQKLKHRFEKNRDRLFTFLQYDNVPWHNNNAEHAVKAYARLRCMFTGQATPKAISEYLIFLSLCQTCKYMGVDFLDFLRSGEKDIHAFAEGRRGRKRRTQSSQPPDLPANAIPDSGGQS